MAGPPGPSVMTPRTPTLIPDFDTPFEHGVVRVIDLDDNLSEIGSEGIYGTFAQATQTIVVSNAGAGNADPTLGDVIGITFAFASTTVTAGGTPFYAQTAPLQASPTTTTTAAAIVTAINTSMVLSKFVFASSAAATVTITAVRPGVLGNSIVSVLSRVVGTTFQTTTPSGFGTVNTFTGGTGNVATPFETFHLQAGRSVLMVSAGRPVLVPPGSPLLTTLKTCGRVVV